MNTQPPTSRRHFLKHAALAALPALASAGCASLPGFRQRGYIDAHVHVWTPDIVRFPLATGFKPLPLSRRCVRMQGPEENGVKPAPYEMPLHFTPEDLFAQCRPAGVERVVLVQMQFYRFDNSYMLSVMDEHPGVFSGIGMVDETGPDVGRTMRRLAERGVRGFRVHAVDGSADGWHNSAGVQAMWRTAAETGQAICILGDPGSLPVVAEMCRQHPSTRVVIDHFARIGMRGPVQPGDVDNLCRLADCPNIWVKTSAYYALGAKKAPYLDMAPLVRRVRDAFGASRLMWGSDSPWQVENGHKYARSIQLIRDRLDFLTASDKEWMLRKTAEQLFFT